MFKYFRNQCPECKQSVIFPGVFRMHAQCPNCGNRFEKESGYFIGAMIASYFICAFLALPTLLLAIFKSDLEILPALGITTLQVILLQPILFRYSRILWINIEAELTRSIHQGSK